jgi:hypothetical protein
MGSSTASLSVKEMMEDNVILLHHLGGVGVN